MGDGVSKVSFVMIPVAVIGAVRSWQLAMAFANARSSGDEHRSVFGMLFLHLAEPLFTLLWWMSWAVILVFMSKLGPPDWLGVVVFMTLPMAMLLFPVFAYREAGLWAFGLLLLGIGRWASTVAFLMTLDLGLPSVEVISMNGLIAVVGTALLYGSCYCARRVLQRTTAEQAGLPWSSSGAKTIRLG